MDPFSITAGVVGIADTVTKLSCVVAQFREDYKLADEELDIARQHALLLKEEIRALESRKASTFSASRKTSKGLHGHDGSKSSNHASMEEVAFVKALTTAQELLTSIETAFPLRSEPHTWRSKMRWALKDNKVLVHLKNRLKSAESTLQGIASMEQLRVSHLIYEMLLQQQSTMDKLERGELVITNNVINMAIIDQNDEKSPPSYVEAQFSEVKPIAQQPTRMITRPNKLLPWTVHFNRWGFSAHLIKLPKLLSTSYRAAVHVSLFNKMYSVQMRTGTPDFTFDRMLHVRNIIPTDSAMTVACRTGNFDTARKLLEGGMAHGSDITPGGWPMLDYAIESGSSRLVRLLLEYGANLDISYGDHNMTALQSSFLRGRLDIARLLLTRGADIEHVDSDGYSVLSYLWVVDKPLEKSEDFMRLCLAHEFAEVNTCDSRGWSAFHRAAAIGTSSDITAFLRLGASLDIRAEWYGWTALFFAASHDNVDTFETIIKHSGCDVYESLDGDGWTLLHCCIYFGAPRVMRMVLQNGTDVNQLSHPAPLPEDPELSYRELTPCDIALYIGPNRYRMFMDALVDTGRLVDLDGTKEDVFWDVTPYALRGDDAGAEVCRPIYGAEDIDEDRFSLLHWASYNGSPKIRNLFLLKGVDPEHLDAMELAGTPTVLPISPFDGR